MFEDISSKIVMRGALSCYDYLSMFDSENKSYSKRLSIVMTANLIE